MVFLCGKNDLDCISINNNTIIDFIKISYFMNRDERVKELIKKYFEGNLSDAEEDYLFFLMQDNEFENAVYSSQYIIWKETSEKNKRFQSEEIFNRIKEKSDINEDKLTQDDLILNGLKFQEIRSHRINSFLKYAAVFIFAVFFSGLAYYLIGKAANKTISHHEITVPSGSKIKIVLSDSSVVWLNSESKLTYPDHFSEKSREVLLEGEAFFDIAKSSHIPFYIRTNDINIKVLGTRLNVKAYPEEDIVETTLISGNILIEENIESELNKEKIRLISQQKAIYIKESQRLMLAKKESSKSQSPEVKDEVNVLTNNCMQKYQDIVIDTSWKDNKLIFRDEHFTTLVKRIERWYDVEIKIMDEEIYNYRFTGSLENETVEQALNAFKIASSLDYRINKNQVEVFKSNN